MPASKSFTIAVCGRKGGVGKTSTALGLATVFARLHKRTLLVDLDPQGSMGVALGLDEDVHSTAAAWRGLKKSSEPHAIDEHLNVSVGSPEIEDLNLKRPTKMEAWLASRKEEIIIFDCPPVIGHLDRFAMNKANCIIVLTEAHRMAIAGAEKRSSKRNASVHAPNAVSFSGVSISGAGSTKTSPKKSTTTWAKPQ